MSMATIPADQSVYPKFPLSLSFFPSFSFLPSGTGLTFPVHTTNLLVVLDVERPRFSSFPLDCQVYPGATAASVFP